MEDRHESDVGITSHAEGQPRNHDVEDCAVDIEQEHRETGKEEDKGDMNKYRRRSGELVEVPLVESLCVVSTDSCSDAWGMSYLGRPKVGMRPLLYQYCQESPSKTHDEAQKPECVNQDCELRWREFGWIRRGGLGGGIGE